MVLGKDELIESVRKAIGETPSEEGVALLENVADSFGDLETKIADFDTRLKDAEVESQAKLDTLEAEWKERYTKRFAETKDATDIDLHGETEESEMKTFADLFTEG